MTHGRGAESPEELPSPGGALTRETEKLTFGGERALLAAHVELHAGRAAQVGRPQVAADLGAEGFLGPLRPADVVGFARALHARARHDLRGRGRGRRTARRRRQERVHALVQLVGEHSPRLALEVVGPEVADLHAVHAPAGRRTHTGCGQQGYGRRRYLARIYLTSK